MPKNFKVEAKRLSRDASDEDRQKNFDILMRNFRRAADAYDLDHIMKEHQFYQKPSEKKRRKKERNDRERIRLEQEKGR